MVKLGRPVIMRWRFAIAVLMMLTGTTRHPCLQYIPSLYN
jgi:hypothetical protein